MDNNGPRVNEEMFEKAVAGVQELLEDRNRETASRWFEELISLDRTVSLTAGTGLVLHREGELNGTLWREGRRCFSLDAETARGTVRIVSRTGKSVRVGLGEDRGREFIFNERDKLDKIIAAEKRMKEHVERFLDDETVGSILRSRDLHPTRIISSDFVLRFGFTDPNGVVIIRAAADAEQGEYRIDGERFRKDERFREALIGALRDYDPEAELRRAEKELRKRLRRLLDDRGFQRYIAERDLTLRREDASNVYLDNTAGEVVAVFTCRPESGKIVLETEHEEDSRTLYQSSASVDTEGYVRFLLIGINNDFTDTILLAQADEHSISLISIPRDIYREGYKINQLYASLGPAALIDSVQELTGVPIDHYVAVDTGGFGDIVDALGEITVKLDTEILDPSMYYRKGDERRMLYFSAGEHEINGSAALALARSRNTTSDFSRSARQQVLLTGIRERLEQLSLTEAGSVVNFIKTAFEYSETDISVLEAVQYFRNYRDVERIRRTVLSTDNVFYSTYRELHQRGLELEEAAEFTEEELGAWILRPVDEDWDIVSRYVKDWLSEKEPAVENYRSGGDDIDR